MPTIITHAVVGAALAQLGPPAVPRGRLTFALVVLSVFPDVDVAGLRLGIPYSHWLGHRGFSHSLLFGLGVAAIVARVEFRRFTLSSRDGWRVFALCTLAIVSHGILDAFTDGGLGVAFFLPFDRGRYFFPIHPLVVSPIGLSSFLAGPVWAVLGSEVLYVWIPVIAVVALLRPMSRRGCLTRRCS